MKNLIICIVLNLIVQSSFGRQPNATTPEEEATITYNELKSCQVLTERSEIIKCVSKLTSMNLNERITTKISFWLKSTKLEKALKPCPPKQMELFPQSSKNNYKIVKCFDFKQNSASKQGIIYLLDEGGLMKIDGIQFL